MPFSHLKYHHVPDGQAVELQDEVHEEHPNKGGPRLGFLDHIQLMLYSSRINILLVFVLGGIGVWLADLNPLLVFTCNAIAIIPLSALLTNATERIAAEAGETIGALLNISFGNLVELILL